MAHGASWKGSPRIKGYSNMQRMAMLTFSLVGLQFTWGIEMTYFTPYLLQLGMAKSQTSLVWIAPPLSGLIVQPIVGTISDSSKLRWGRRRPYMLLSSLLVAVNFLVLGWATEIVGVFFTDKAWAEKATVTLAVFCIYAVDFAINAVQTTCRSLIVDTLQTSEQQLGSAWAGRMLGVGHVLGYFAGTLDMSKFFGTVLGATQFKQVCVIASATMVSCVGLTCFCVKERVLLSKGDEEAKFGALKMFSTILKTTLHLPRKIKAVCWITFWCWFGWSPFFVYGTTWVGETYYRQSAGTATELRNATDPVGVLARKGSGALFLFSLIALAGSIILPWVVESPDDDPLSSITKDQKGLSRTIDIIRRYRIDITTAWGISQVAFGASMILAPFSRSFEFATLLVALCGIPWAMYGWAPLAIMGEEINKLEASSNSNPAYASLSRTEDNTVELPDLSSHLPRHSLDSNDSQPSQLLEDTSDTDSVGMAGVYLGIWNIFATIPQFIATFIAMVTFMILEPGKSGELNGGNGAPGGGVGGGNGTAPGTGDGNVPSGLSGTAVCLAIGAVCSFVAATQSFRMRRY